MSRAEPCPIHGCTEFKMSGRPFCRDHWRRLSASCRTQISRAMKRIINAARFGDAAGFRNASARYQECCGMAAEIIEIKENTYERD
jgi:hypothetical protein